MLKLSAAKRRHLVSAYATVRHMCLQMEEAARDGRSPTGVGPPLTALAPQQAEPILEPARRLRDRLREIAEELAPRELSDLERRQPPANTFVWLSNLLDHVRIAVDDLQPRRVRKYGELESGEETLWDDLHRELFQHVQQSRAGLDASSNGSDVQ